MTEKVLITSALPYVNNVPHLGNIIGCVLSADVFARYCRLRGKDTLYVCGTDEHGTATEVRALEEGLTPKEITDKYFAIHKEIYEWFGCKFDCFGRTSMQVHHKATQEIFLKLKEKGLVSEDMLEQMFCGKCEKFLADRFIEGKCPHCGYEGARGDQCENCSKLLNPEELVDSKCKVCGERPVVKESRHLFLGLDKLQPMLEEWVARQEKDGFWTDNAKKITRNWLNEGLKKRCISRDLSWGVKIPVEGFEKKVFYVWFDAPIGYISITQGAREDWADWWKGGKARLYQFMAKDNVPFHTIIFPASLMGTGDNWNLLYHINSTEYLNYESGQFSKSKGVGVFGGDAMNSGIPADVWRYYLLRNRPETADSQFNWDDFMEKTNHELIANLGNLVNRTISFTNKFFGSRVPEGKWGEEENLFWDEVKEKEGKIAGLMDKVKEKEGIQAVMDLSKLGNQFFQEQEPWKKVKESKEKAAPSINALLNLVKDLAVLAGPFLPFSAEKIREQLKLGDLNWDNLGKQELKGGEEIGEAAVLFNKIEKEKINEMRDKFSGKK